MCSCRFWRIRMAAVWNCGQRCSRNLQKTWWPRLNRAVRIGAITTLALHLSVSKTLPLIGGMPGQDWCISSYSLASTTLPEQSGAVFSGLWVWCFTLTCIAVITLILFPVLSFGAALGRSMCLVLFLVILSWMTVMRLPMTHRVAPFASDVDISSMTSFAYIYIPYTAASVILSQQNRAFDTDLHTGLLYIANYNIGVLSMALLGWALFTLQVMLPPWSSQRHNVRVMLSQIMCDVRSAVSDISVAFGDLRHMLRESYGQGAATEPTPEKLQNFYRSRESTLVLVSLQLRFPETQYPGRYRTKNGMLLCPPVFIRAPSVVKAHRLPRCHCFLALRSGACSGSDLCLRLC